MYKIAPTMRLTGFTDEASATLAGQIKATKELGWQHLSARTIGTQNIHDLEERSFERVCEQLAAAEIQVAEFGTLIGSWSKSINSDWAITLAEIQRCIPRMQRLGVRYARIMSYAQCAWGDDQMEQERFRRVREIVARFKDAGIEALHENCMNWGGFSADHTLRLLEEVPDLRLVFDTGNPVFQKDRSLPPNYPWQDALVFYEKVKHAIAHIHIKDGYVDASTGASIYQFAGAGQAQVVAILADLKKNKYEGFIAIEPHIGKVFHETGEIADSQKIYEVYVEYGQRFGRLLKNID